MLNTCDILLAAFPQAKICIKLMMGYDICEDVHITYLKISIHMSKYVTYLNKCKYVKSISNMFHFKYVEIFDS
jgi:hypothetical protein